MKYMNSIKYDFKYIIFIRDRTILKKLLLIKLNINILVLIINII